MTTDEDTQGNATEQLLNAYQRFFQLELAHPHQQRQGSSETHPDAERRQELYRLRYDVYCQEFGFEREADCPGRMEWDAFDEHAWHGLIRHVSTGKAAGSARIIEKQASGEDDLPLLAYCKDSLYPAWRRHLEQLERPDTICEVSRLAVHTDFRRRPGEDTPYGKFGAAPFPEDHVRTFPLLTAALFAAAIYLVFDALDKRAAYMMMEPRLQRMLRRFGLRAEQVGDPIEYHGQRAAYRIGREQAMAAISGSQILDRLYHLAAEQLQEPVTEQAARCG